MRIGTLSKKYNIPVDSLYYYIKVGLLVPLRKGKRYSIDDTCERDLKLIITYKQWGFSLKEIHSILTRYRISCTQQPEDVRDIIIMLQNKYEQLEKEKDEISRKQQAITNAKSELSRTEKHKPNKLMGVPLSMLDMLRCPSCGGAFSLSAAKMDNRCIYDADVSCTCGYAAKITDGIFITGNRNVSRYDRPDLQREFYRDMPDELISIYQKSYNWMGEHIDSIGIDKKVIMETHLNAYFSLQFQLDRLEKHKCKVVLTDKFPEILALYKDFLEERGTSLDILFIADNSTHLPLAEGSVDIFIDFFGSNEHQFYNQSSLINELAPYFSPSAQIIGTYFSIRNGQRSIRSLIENYPEACHDNFNLYSFRKGLDSAGFTKVESAVVGKTSNVGSNWCFGFMAKGDSIELLSFWCKRNIAPAFKQESAPPA
ncbi:MerR family transcriptional regulator [Synergistes jonesii]|mgnify:CR=1 FL=1|uniref:MerR family transcriptional regulator n=1 Tax=Synergistes jonesii TaxID=2754 RepID=UPI00248E5089|nr:MerR family transcriptional regulator [Synergistes jonesii]